MGLSYLITAELRNFLSSLSRDTGCAPVVERLSALKNRLNLQVRRAYWDKGFCRAAVCATLRAHRLPDIIPIPLCGKQLPHATDSGGISRLFTGRRSDYTRYTFNQGQPDEYTTDVALLRTYRRGRYGRHGVP